MRWELVLWVFLFAIASTVASSVYHYDNEENAAKQHIFKIDHDESSAGKIALENDIEFDPSDFGKHEEESKSDESSEESGKPSAAQQSTLSKIFSSVLSVPRSIFRAIGNFLSSAPLTRLRDEVKSLNISYPKNS